MVGQVKSISGKSIRLTDERWAHITEEHSEMSGYRTEVLETVNQPESVFQGGAGECLAVRECENGNFLWWCIVKGREVVSSSPRFKRAASTLWKGGNGYGLDDRH